MTTVSKSFRINSSDVKQTNKQTPSKTAIKYQTIWEFPSPTSSKIINYLRRHLAMQLMGKIRNHDYLVVCYAVDKWLYGQNCS